MSDSDVMLFDRWRRGRDAEAFTELVSRYGDMVYGTCRRVTGDPSAAEDVAQECFLKLAEGRTKVRSSVAGWLHSLATCRSLDRLRSEGRRRRTEERFLEAAKPAEVGWDDLQQHVDEAIEELPPRLRAVIVRHFLQGETHAEIAADLGVSRPAVSRSVARGIERVRRSLRRKGITIAATALVTIVTANAVEAAPASLKAAMGRLALSGGPTTAVAGAGMALLAKVAAVALGLLVVGGAAAYRWMTPSASVALAPLRTAVAALPEPTPQAVNPAINVVSSAPAPATVPVAAEEPRKAPSRVAGLVRDGDGKPIADAAVQVSAAEAYPAIPPVLYTARTGADGRYAIDDVYIEGEAAVRASAVGFCDNLVRADLKPGEAVEDADVTMWQGVSFVGQVLSPGGLPVPGAVVLTHDWSISTDSFTWNDGAFVILTDEKGMFRMGRRGQKDEDNRLDGLDVVAPGGGAASFRNVAFRDEEVVPLRLQQPAAIRGRITWADGSPVGGCAVRVKGITQEGGTDEDGRELGMMFTTERGTVADADGRYEIRDLPPNLPYVVWMRTLNDEFTEYLSRDRRPIVAGAVRVWDYEVARPACLHGRVLVEGTGEPFLGAHVEAVGQGPVSLFETDFQTEEGRYRMYVSKPGQYLVYAGYEADYANTDSLKPYGKTVEVKVGEEIELDLPVPPPFVVPVRVVDPQGRPVPKARIHLCWLTGPEMPGLEEGTEGQTERAPDAEGRYTWYCEPGTTVWVRATAKGCYPAKTEQMVAEASKKLPEQLLVLHPSASLKATIVVPEEVKADGGILLRATYPDGTTEDMRKTFWGQQTEYVVLDAVRAGRMSVMAVEAGPESKHASQSVECTVAPGEMHDLGLLVVE